MISTLVSLSLFVMAAEAGKRGLCWPYYNKPLNPSLFNTGDGNVVAIYDYETYAPPSSNGDGGLGFIGMQRCTDCPSSPIASLASLQSAQGWSTVFTLNEPDLSVADGNSAYVSPSDAASWYQKNINSLPIKKALPAVTSSTNSGEGLSWLSQMITACAGSCSYDYINLHWYGNSFADFQSYVESANTQFPGVQIVVTEFALGNPAGGQADQVAFFKSAFAFLDSATYVELYFPFVATSPSLLTANGGSADTVVGTGSCLFNDDGSISAVGELLV
ncbi:glycoside hydrolase family 128 protein [Athelia psychrophila]|uniref:Glycoside hydrolase family 128 protein n=1 Tax=Athelia psychrophila TaxID=1759441 RepID=A0A167VE60_9AGAM|nr:glycoside hydrolase family 128 protein [Fibularhizoctonia sp. CBS 109695]